MGSAETKQELWTVKRALDWVRGYLERKGDENPRVSSEWLLSEVCGLRRIELYLNPERPLDRAELDTLHDYVARRASGEPLQYITGEAPFRYIAVKVRPGVLIPRPETEVLVSEALACLPAPAKREAAWNTESAEKEAEAVAQLKARIREAAEAAASQRQQDGEAALALGSASADGAGDDAESARGAVEDAAPSASESLAEPGDSVAVEGASSGGGAAAAESAALPSDEPEYCLVADICTGSGCIACSMASERDDVRVIAVDVDAGAVALARENAQALGLHDKVRVLQGDLGEPVPPRYLGRFDVVVSNPPYVPTGVLAEIPREVADFEPALALDGGADGLDVFRRLAAWARIALKPGGAFACELHETHLDQAAEVARAAGFESVRIVDDLAGKPRVLVAR